jgi:histidyl-tRNA synthetase
MQGLRGTVRSGIRVLPGALPELRQPALSTVPSLVHNDAAPNLADDEVEKKFDVFISHASEDKDEVVRPLANALRDEGLKVWYDEFEMKIGDSLRRKIDKGLANSRFGVVVLSKEFIKKGWTNYELDGIITKSVTGEQVVLPIWHNITKKEVIDFSPSLADKLARNTSSYTVEEIATEIAEVIQSANT